MELNPYQQKVINDLSAYMDSLNQTKNLFHGWENYWKGIEIAVGSGGVPCYNNKIVGVPHVCMKVPTGGGKTFLACASIRQIFDRLPLSKKRLVIWLVPSDSILSQTTAALTNKNHPYRVRLERDFGSRVSVCTKEMLLAGQDFSPDDVANKLTLCVLSYASLRIDSKKKDVRKVYQENGNLRRFADQIDNREVLLPDTPDTALIQILRSLSPVVVVDESHNAGSDLSAEMLQNLNPSFILDLTATPRESSNIISYVDARELKKQNMVKLPVVVFGRSSRQSVITDAILLRGNIEKQAKDEESAGGQYIRPIILFQAQPKVKEDSETFEKIKQVLIDMGIPENEIAIKTSKVDNLGQTNLMSRDCPIRYIITVNALKEGWDCPFAYILASLANKTSEVDVEQILGIILRQPYAVKHNAPLLNTSYVLACSRDFTNTLEHIVAGLNQAGFSRKDYRLAEEAAEETDNLPAATHGQEKLDLSASKDNVKEENGKDDFADIDPAAAKTQLDAGQNNPSEMSQPHITDMERVITTTTQEYQRQTEQNDDSSYIGGELSNMANQFSVQTQYQDVAYSIKLPQFFRISVPDLFGGEHVRLEPENLSDDFKLEGQNAVVSFELATGEVYRVDVQTEGEAVPKYQKATRSEADFLRQYVDSLPPEGQLSACISSIAAQINKNDRYETHDVEKYVRRVVGNMTENELNSMKTALPFYAKKIQDKIEQLEIVFREQTFRKWLDAGKIICLENYSLPKKITLADSIDAIPKSLYEAEKNDMNKFERELIDALVTLPNICWWHRIIDRKGFRINGYINHYPDFLVHTKSGKIVLVEAKGDYLDGDDSKAKLALGRYWQSKAGGNYRYFMVFKNKELNADGAYTLDKFIEMMKEI